ncbi:MAG: hypothetical protein ACREA2_12860 [Blastocatellia bacterium]
MRSNQITKSLFLILLTVAYALPALAQSEGQAARDARQLRFASKRPVEHLRLQVHDAAGALIHDSGLVAKSDLVWSMLDGNGNVLKSGQYDWTLTVKEPGEASPRIKRGQLDIENTNEPTSASALAPVTVGGSGTVGKIPKWTTATELGDSVIIEDNGNVAIGSTPGAIFKLHVFLKPPDKNSHDTINAVLAPSDDPDGHTTGSAVAGFATNSIGGTIGVKGVSYSRHGIGVVGSAVSDTGRTFGVRGRSLSPDGIGVQGEADSTTGENIGVRGESKSSSGIGVYGLASEAAGINYGVKGESASPNGLAGYFVGNVEVTGNLTKGGGNFKIDHPLDPENKYLSHSFVESPDMMNIYNGIVTLGKNGSAEVTLPDWFEALNREFRYQLTCIGGFAPVYVAKKVSGNRFKIAGGKPGMEVSWQLTGVRKDAYAETHRIQVEEMKPIAERGSYLHPEAFGKSSEKSTAYEKTHQR